MILYGINGQTVELRITGYEFQNTTGDIDDDWLLVYLNVKSLLGNWQTIDSSLLTWELAHLIDWFKDLAANRNLKHEELEFLEPNLSFEFLGNEDADHKNFRIKFDLESRPQSAKDDEEYFVDFSVDKPELERIANSLELELRKFPQRYWKI